MELIKAEEVEELIFTVREKKVMLDYHLAEVYQVETKRLNEQVKRNKGRFPEAFMFQLTQEEWDALQSQIATTKVLNILQSQNATAKRRTLPYVFTEQGVAMLSAVLSSDTAIAVSIQIIDAFVNMRKQLSSVSIIDHRLKSIEAKQLETDQKLDDVFKALEGKTLKKDEGIFFNGQIFDAYTFICDLVRTAKTSIILIDNYVDDTTLTMLAKRNTDVTASIYTQAITKQLKLDLEKHNQQYPRIVVKNLKTAHDRFLILDEKELYHIGASLKDAGKKWFAFSKMDTLCTEVLNKLDQ